MVTSVKNFNSHFIFLFILIFSSINIFGQDVENFPERPPMGWNSWNYFGKNDVNEEIIKEVIDAMAEKGLDSLGYEYIVVDGGWRRDTLGKNGELLVNYKFPNGMKALADYAHSKGFKFGLHTVPGSHDCGLDKVGGWGHEKVQFDQFMDWGLDFIKLDRCRFSLDDNPDYARSDKRWFEGWGDNGENIEKAYTIWHKLIEEFDRDIFFSASVYRFYNWYPELTHMGRTTGDIKSIQTGGAVFDDPDRPNIHSVMNVADLNDKYYKYAGPGYWNDPDMLVTGEQGLTYEEEKAHFALWCIMSSPLILGNDPRNMTDQEFQIISNKMAIEINQDPTEQGHKITQNGSSEIWAKKLKDGSYGVLLLNRDPVHSKDVVLDFEILGLDGELNLVDVYAKQNLGNYKKQYKASVGAHAGIFLKVNKK